jgi:exosortase
MPKREWKWIAPLGLAFTPAIVAMAEVWSSVDYYSHGFLVPLFAFASFHANRSRLGEVLRDARGVAVIVLALVLYLLGVAAGSVTLQGFALVTAVAGVVLRLWGPVGLRRLAFPVGFLVFMVPLPAEWLAPIILRLQFVVSSVSVQVLESVGISVAREGNVLRLPGGEALFVAEACSGITSIVTLLPLGVALAYFTEKSWQGRSLIIAAVVPLAMLGNLIRVVATVMAADTYGVEQATQSTLHELAGLLTFVLACCGLLAVGSLLRLRWRVAEGARSRL